MASSYPGALDASFPGYPYVDNTEYVLANYANSWVLAIQAIENTIGFGTGGVATNPLFSTAYPGSSPFSTITARILHAEQLLLNQIQLDTTAGDIQPVGASAVAGSSGKAADAKHVHQGVTSVNGRSGAITIQTTDVSATTYTAQGQVVVGTGNGTSELLPIGAAGSILTVGGSDPSGLQWAPPAQTGVFGSGDVKWTTAIVIQTGWLAANGQAVSRSTYASLLTATTIAFTATVSGQTISGISQSQTAYMATGMSIELNGAGSSCTITGVSQTSITVSTTPSQGSQSCVVFPYGNGNGSTTFNVVNMLGKVPVGIGGTGSNASPTYAMGQSGGEQTHSVTTAELPPHLHSISDPGHFHGISDPSHAHGGSTSTEIGTHIHNFGGNQYVLIVGSSSLHLSTSGANPVSFDSPQTATGSELEPHYHTFSTGNSYTGINNTNINSTGITTTGSTGSGFAGNNMQPFVAGQFLVKT
jgi:microcystin-dependent protein